MIQKITNFAKIICLNTTKVAGIALCSAASLHATSSSESISSFGGEPTLCTQNTTAMQENVCPIVFGTDRNYLPLTMVAALQIMAHATQQTTIIMLCQDVSKRVMLTLPKMSTDLCHIYTAAIPADILAEAKGLVNGWHVLVAVRLFYPQIISLIKSGKIKTIGPERKSLEGLAFKYFLHLDQDIFLYGDPLSMLKENSLYLEFAGVELTIIVEDNVETQRKEKKRRKSCYMREHGNISGGYVLWNIEVQNKNKIEPDTFINRIKNKIKEKEANYWMHRNLETVKIYEALKADKSGFKLLQDISKSTDNEENLKKALEENSEDSSNEKLIKAFLRTYTRKYRDAFTEYGKFAFGIQRFCEYLPEQAEDKDSVYATNKIVPLEDLADPERNKMISATEEDVFYCYHGMDLKYNFQAKYILPEIDNSPKGYWEYRILQFGISDQLDLMRQATRVGPGYIDTILTATKELVVFHFDGGFKPSSPEFYHLAVIYPHLRSFVTIYKDHLAIAMMCWRESRPPSNQELMAIKADLNESHTAIVKHAYQIDYLNPTIIKQCTLENSLAGNAEVTMIEDILERKRLTIDRIDIIEVCLGRIRNRLGLPGKGQLLDTEAAMLIDRKIEECRLEVRGNTLYIVNRNDHGFSWPKDLHK
ncbi:MAG: hypothetical protein LBF56_01900 [Holosporales bacterium]|jgi:hypothetical protein|nr:hypothetical protein [Holosporales bacterium]